MPLRHLPDFLKHGACPREGGGQGTTYPRPTPEARLRSMIGTALPDLPPPGNHGSHDPVSAREALGVEWLRHLWAGRIG